MNFYDWMLALHLLSAFSVAAALVLYSVLVVSGRRSSATLADARLLFRVAPVATTQPDRPPWEDEDVFDESDDLRT